MLHLKWLSSALLLLMLAGGVNGQIVGAVVFGENITKEQEASAKAIIRQLEANNFQWNVGDFQIFQKGASAKGELMWDISDESIIEIKDIPPDTRLMIDNAIRAGESTAKDHDFPAQKASYWKFKGIKAGTTNVSIYGVSEDKLRVVRIAKMKITVGTPKPPPPPPDLLSDFEKSIQKAMNTDIAANKGTKTHVELLAGIYRGAANSLPPVTTAGELYATLQKAIVTAGVPAPAQSLPTMRALIATELNKKLPTETDKQLTLEDRNRITATFGAMADSLEAILGAK